MLKVLLKYLFEIDPNLTKAQQLKLGKAYIKMTLLILLTVPFWAWPLLFAAIIRFVEAEEMGGLSSFSYLTLLPTIYAYLSLLNRFIDLQKKKVRGNFQVPSFKQLMSEYFNSLVKITVGQILALVLNNFSEYSLVEVISLQIFYFFAHVLVYFYALILKDMPVNQNMRRLWEIKNNN
jgi:hypothetical protein